MDDDDIGYVRRNKVVHYGSLANNEQLGNNQKNAASAGSNVQVSTDFMTLSKDENPSQEIEDRTEYLEDFERKKRARLIHVTTDDSEVKKDLRQLGEPICKFGEGPAERRARLRGLLSELGEDAIRRKKQEDDDRIREEREHDETTWYHEGPAFLRVSRQWIAEYSLPRAKERIARLKAELALPDVTRMAKQQETQNKLH